MFPFLSLYPFFSSMQQGAWLFSDPVRSSVLLLAQHQALITQYQTRTIKKAEPKNHPQRIHNQLFSWAALTVTMIQTGKNQG